MINGYAHAKEIKSLTDAYVKSIGQRPEQETTRMLSGFVTIRRVAL
ncbi:hypothetical protein ACR3AM_003139 [Bacillus thuringiensis]